MDQQSYKTIEKYAADEFVERKSRFIGYISPVQTEEEAMEFIGQIRSKHWDATHNVYAYVLRDGNIRRYSDDGEPSGTAGVPVLDVLQKEGLTDAVVVVTRYFGGIMLGAGGLVRAYSHGAKIAVDAAQTLWMHPCTLFQLQMEYPMYGKINYILPDYAAAVEESDFGVAVTMKILMKDELLPRFYKHLRELTADTVVPCELEKRFAPMAESVF